MFFYVSKEWERRASIAGRKSGDLTFPLVYCPEFHFPEFNSSVADMKNSVAVSVYTSVNNNKSLGDLIAKNKGYFEYVSNI